MARRVFVTDWDETATVRDTTALIARVASRTGGGVVPPFSHFSRIYMDAYTSYMEKCAEGCGKRENLEEETEFQKGMKAVEMASIVALENTGYFKGFPIASFHCLVPEIELQPGFIDFITRANCPIYILSVNWCKGLIEKVLEKHGVANVTVLANDLETDGDGVTTGFFDKRFDIRTGHDKARELARIRGAHADSEIFYFGDSSGDVLPILSADCGGVITGGKGRKVLDKLADVYPVQAGFASSSLRVFEGTWPGIAAAWK